MNGPVFDIVLVETLVVWMALTLAISMLLALFLERAAYAVLQLARQMLWRAPARC